jgi:hypothetical protein
MVRKTETIAAFLLVLIGVQNAWGQHTHEHPRDTASMIGAADAAMSGHLSDAAKKHMELSPERRATRADSVRAAKVVRDLRAALGKYSDTAAAVADGYRMFMPNLKTQRVYHFTNYRRAFLGATSSAGSSGAMDFRYLAPSRQSRPAPTVMRSGVGSTRASSGG